MKYYQNKKIQTCREHAQVDGESNTMATFLYDRDRERKAFVVLIPSISKITTLMQYRLISLCLHTCDGEQSKPVIYELSDLCQYNQDGGNNDDR